MLACDVLPLLPEHLGDNSQRVREVGLGRNDRLQRTLTESAVTKLAPARATHAPNFTHRIRREVVVVHEALGLFRRKRVQLLPGAHRPERHDAEDLRFTALEQARAMRARQDADVAGDRPQLVECPSIRALAFFENTPAHRLLDHGLQGFRELTALNCSPNLEASSSFSAPWPWVRSSLTDSSTSSRRSLRKSATAARPPR